MTVLQPRLLVLQPRLLYTPRFVPKLKFHCYVLEKRLQFLQIVLKMSEGRYPPSGAFKLNPLNIVTNSDANVNQNQQHSPITPSEDVKSCNEKSLDIPNTEPQRNTEISMKDHVTVADVSDAHTSNVKKEDSSMVMMKMIISGPPSQTKKQTVLPESLLQKVTEIVRQQTTCQDGVAPEAVTSQFEQCSPSVNKELKDTLIDKQDIQITDNISKHRLGHIPDNVIGEEIVIKDTAVALNASLLADIDSSPSLRTESLTKIAQGCTGKEGNIYIDSNSTERLSKTAQDFVEKEASISIESDGTKRLAKPAQDFVEKDENINIESDIEIMNCVSCSSICSDMETEKSANKISEVSESSNLESDLDDRKDMCTFPVPGETEDTEMETKENGNESTESDTDPFSNLLIGEEDIGSNKNDHKKDTDKVFNISHLFSGELEKWRKRELKKEKQKSFRKTKKISTTHSEDTTAGKDGEKAKGKERKEHKPIPNYFVAVQISDPKIRAGIQKVQEDVVFGNKALQPALNKLATLHLTMFVVHLRTEDEMIRAKQALDLCSKKLRELYQDQLLTLDVCGLGNFRNNVVFAKVSSTEQVKKLKEIADIVEDCFLDNEIVSTEKSDSFKPHITVMKLTRDKSFRKKGGIKKIDETLYKDHKDVLFGRQDVNTLQLCAMLKKKAESGYYQVEHSVQFGPDIDEVICGSQENKSENKGNLNKNIDVRTSSDDKTLDSRGAALQGNRDTDSHEVVSLSKRAIDTNEGMYETNETPFSSQNNTDTSDSVSKGSVNTMDTGAITKPTADELQIIDALNISVISNDTRNEDVTMLPVSEDSFRAAELDSAATDTNIISKPTPDNVVLTEQATEGLLNKFPSQTSDVTVTTSEPETYFKDMDIVLSEIDVIGESTDIVDIVAFNTSKQVNNSDIEILEHGSETEESVKDERDNETDNATIGSAVCVESMETDNNILSKNLEDSGIESEINTTLGKETTLNTTREIDLTEVLHGKENNKDSDKSIES